MEIWMSLKYPQCGQQPEHFVGLAPHKQQLWELKDQKFEHIH